MTRVVILTQRVAALGTLRAPAQPASKTAILIFVETPPEISRYKSGRRRLIDPAGQCHFSRELTPWMHIKVSNSPWPF